MLVQCDASQLEWRCAVDLSADPVGIKEIREKLDVHTINQEAFQLPTRLVAKKYLFRTIYRGSGYAFAKDSEFNHVSEDPEFWDNVNTKFYGKYKGLDRKHHSWAQDVVAGKPLQGPTGRIWPIPMGVDNKGNAKVPWTVLTNYPVQGTSADIMGVARVSLFGRLRASGISGLLVSSVHDSIVVDTKSVDKVAELMHNVFRDIPANFKKLFNYEMNVPYECEVKVGNNLTDMEKYAIQH